MTTAGGVLIAGTGQAGVEVAAALRMAGYGDSITMVGGEAHPPYQRPPLSKGWLTGTRTATAIELRSREWYAANRVELITGDPIVGISPYSSAGGTATTAQGQTIEFGQLVLATGAESRKITCPGADLPGVHYLRTAHDADSLADALAGAASVAVIGGGFIGLEVAVAARKLGAKVTVLEASPRLLRRAVAEPTSEFYQTAHRRRGVDVFTAVRLEAFEERNGRVAGVRLRLDADGDTTRYIPADVIVVGIGVSPLTKLGEDIGLHVDNGIVVDERMIASDMRTIAVGDCANMPVPGGGQGSSERVRLESVPNAVEQARIAAATLMGRAADYEAVPWFWSDQGDLKLQIAGLSIGYDRLVMRGDPSSERFSVLYYRDGTILAADCINSPKDFAAIRTALRTGAAVPADAASDPAVPLRDILKKPIPSNSGS